MFCKQLTTKNETKITKNGNKVIKKYDQTWDFLHSCNKLGGFKGVCFVLVNFGGWLLALPLKIGLGRDHRYLLIYKKSTWARALIAGRNKDSQANKAGR